jgi:hypothetical protein
MLLLQAQSDSFDLVMPLDVRNSLGNAFPPLIGFSCQCSPLTSQSLGQSGNLHRIEVIRGSQMILFGVHRIQDGRHRLHVLGELVLDHSCLLSKRQILVLCPLRRFRSDGHEASHLTAIAGKVQECTQITQCSLPCLQSMRKCLAMLSNTCEQQLCGVFVGAIFECECRDVLLEIVCTFKVDSDRLLVFMVRAF